MHKNLILGDMQDYELLDSGNGMRLERFGSYTLARPDGQAIWKPANAEKWNKADAVFKMNGEKSGRWVTNKPMPEKWIMHHKQISFYARLAPYKHTGIFPEQSVNWDWMGELIRRSGKQANVLNLFAYTGIASLACAEAGAKVTHVDSSYPSIGWARLNQTASKLTEKPIRWIEDDVMRFVEREVKRGSLYDGIIMDPPAYGHGPKGEKWIFEESFPELLKKCALLLTKKPLFVLVNAYAVNFYASSLENVIADYLPKGKTECGELCIREKSAGRELPTGSYCRWTAI